MARRNPEERSATSAEQAGAAPAKPTGDEVYGTPSPETGPEPELTAEQQAELDELSRAAAEAYEQLGRAAERLSDRAAGAYRVARTFVRENPGSTLLTSFVVGVILGALTSRD